MFPEGKKFAFTVCDDTDNATVANVKPVYDLLYSCGIKTTKSTWVYPPRGSCKGSSIQDEKYLGFIHELQDRGFEIGLHNVGDGLFTRQEISDGLDIFKEKIGYYPKIHSNHSANPDNLFWWENRFVWPINLIYKLFRNSTVKRGGELQINNFFWGDLTKRHIRYIRNLTFNNINTIASDPKMPYQINKTAEFSNLWFSSSDGRTVNEFTELISPENIDRLAEDGGICIIYTHFASGFVNEKGEINSQFEKNIRYLSQKNGWFVPASTLLDHLAKKQTTIDPGYLYKLGTNIRWVTNKLTKRLHQNF
jgi:hypothetical protein